jgi:hypothetical protein
MVLLNLDDKTWMVIIGTNYGLPSVDFLYDVVIDEDH